MTNIVVRAKGVLALRIYAAFLILAWLSVLAFLFFGFISYGSSAKLIYKYSFAMMFFSIVVMLLSGRRGTCENCGEEVLTDASASGDSAIASIKPWARVAMLALFTRQFKCPHCDARNLMGPW